MSFSLLYCSAYLIIYIYVTKYDRYFMGELFYYGVLIRVQFDFRSGRAGRTAPSTLSGAGPHRDRHAVAGRNCLTS